MQQGTLNGKPVQMLIDTGWTKTMVCTDYLPTGCLDHIDKEWILCVHRDEVCYPTAEVRLKLGQWSQTARVIVAPGIPVPVLLGTDIYDLSLSNPVMVTTRAQARRDSNLTNDIEGTIEERLSESDSLETVENISVTDTLNGEYGESTEEMEMEMVEQRREVEPTSKPEGLNPLEANVDKPKIFPFMSPNDKYSPSSL